MKPEMVYDIKVKLGYLSENDSKDNYIFRGADMTSVIEDLKVKQKCQTFTPAEKVSQMLDLANYVDTLYGKRILENSCGNGEFLAHIVERYIADAFRNVHSPAEVKEGLERDILAYDIDIELVKICRDRLDEIASRFSLHDVQWNIKCADFLSEPFSDQFDFIVGNPPYIAYRDLPGDVQKHIKEHFETCKKGKFDYCYAFIEKSYKMLSAGGCLVYIIPSNIFKNVFGAEIRKLILNDLDLVVDFPNEKVFEKALVSPSIIRIRKGANTSTLDYSEKFGQTKPIEKRKLSERWFFDLPEDREGRELGKDYQASHSIATLLNDAFVLKDGEIRDGFYYIDNDHIEMEIVKKAASPKNKRSKKHTEHIIFPYAFDDQGNLLRYSEEEMQNRFPGAMAYLNKHKAALESRAADKTALWYEYGRSQAIKNIFGPKVLISKVISDCTEAYLLEEDEIPYSGIYITQSGEATLSDLLNILKSKRFKQYISKVGLSVSGTSRRIITKDIEEYIY